MVSDEDITTLGRKRTKLKYIFKTFFYKRTSFSVIAQYCEMSFDKGCVL